MTLEEQFRAKLSELCQLAHQQKMGLYEFEGKARDVFVKSGLGFYPSVSAMADEMHCGRRTLYRIIQQPQRHTGWKKRWHRRPK